MIPTLIPTLSKGDRETLVKIARQRERLAKSEVEQRAAQLVSDFELQMDREFKFDENAVWEAASVAANAVVAEANGKIAEEVERLGIPKEFAPGLSLHWHGRGQNATSQRRGELRRIAKRQIEAISKTARTHIERQSVATQQAIMVGGLSNDDAREFLNSMPTAEALMPPLDLGSVQAMLPKPKNIDAYG